MAIQPFHGTAPSHIPFVPSHHQRAALPVAKPQTSTGMHPDSSVQASTQSLPLVSIGSRNVNGTAFLQTSLEGNIIGRGLEALKEWWVGWETYLNHGSRIARPSSLKAGDGRGFLGGEGKNHSWHFSVARSISVLVASLIPLGALAAGGLVWKSPRVTFRVMLAVLLLALIFLGSVPPSMRKGGVTTPLIISVWGLFCIGIFLGAPLTHPRERGPRRSREELEKEKQLDSVWDTFFRACSDRGILELQRGRFSSEEVEGAEPRLLIAIPGLVFLHCALDSITQKKERMELPGGTCLAVASNLAEDNKVTTGHRQVGIAASGVFSRLLALDVELQRLAPLSDAEVHFIECRVLQVCPVPLADVHRETEINLVAGALISAATEVTQIPAFKQRMGGAMNEMVAEPKVSTPVDTVSDDAIHVAGWIGHCPVSGLRLSPQVAR